MTRRLAISLWLAFLAISAIIIARTNFTADLSAFLPSSPTPEQRLLVDQLKDGAVSRMLLVGLRGDDPLARAELSKAMAAKLRGQPEFLAVSNGEPVSFDKDRELLFSRRYQLSSTVTPERFTVDGLRAAIGETLDLLASPAGLLVKSMVPADPTGEIVNLIDTLDADSRPMTAYGVWVSRDGVRALLLAQTRATGADTDGQERAITLIRQAHAEARDALSARHPAVRDLTLEITGPGVFSVNSRASIKSEVVRLSTLATAITVVLLLVVYRSLPALALGLLPVVSGALAGVVAVSLGYGTVHGITLGFGTTLIGEAVDYSIYLFIQSRDPANDRSDTLWPTIRMGVLTSIFGFASLLFSGFPGLAQLGLYSIAGLVVAALVTRFVLPHLLPANFRVQDLTPFGNRLARSIAVAHRLRLAIGMLVVVASLVLVAERDRLWNSELGALSPVPKADQDLDAELRGNLGAPDVRYLAVITAPAAESALQTAEQAGARLDRLIDEGVIGGYETPTRFLPSLATQAARQASLPPRDELTDRLAAALAGSPLRAERLAPFLEAADTARTLPTITRQTLDGTSLALAVDALLLQQPDKWTVLLPLRGASIDGHAQAIDAERVRGQLAGLPGVLFVDLKAESDRLYADYLSEAITLSAVGAAAIVLLLAGYLRSARRLLQVTAPLAAAIIVVVACLVVTGERLTILHLVGMLLIVAVGSNYALFFDQSGERQPIAGRTLASLAIANFTTVTGFGLLAFSSVPVLKAIGVTVGPGAVLALLFSAALARGPQGGRAAR